MVQFYPNLAGILLMGMGCKFVQLVLCSLHEGQKEGSQNVKSSPPDLAIKKFHGSYIVRNDLHRLKNEIPRVTLLGPHMGNRCV